MAVGFNISYFWYEIGSSDLLHSFFSTIAYNLENNKWGSRFPIIMNKLYWGELDALYVNSAIEELKTIQEEFKKFSPDKVVWDIEDLSKEPPWGENISNTITDLSNYYVTNDGSDLITVFFHALDCAKELNMNILIDTFSNIVQKKD